MKRREIGYTKNGKLVYVDLEHSHVAAHLADTPYLLALVRELIPRLRPQKPNVYLHKDMGRIVGTSNLVKTTSEDKIIYAKRLNHDNYTRFVLHRKAEPSSFVTIALQEDATGNYALWSAWIGKKAPQFPGDPLETRMSRSFWKTHALVWNSQTIQPKTTRTDWPWS